VSRTPVIACGLYVLNLQCPDCQAVTEIPIVLDTRLTVDSSGAKLSAKLNGKPVDHICNQLRLVPPAPVDDQMEFFRDPDHAERAAGDMT
jgi:hypothetical protein